MTGVPWMVRSCIHMQAGRKGIRWIVRLYLPFRETFNEMPEGEFIRLPIATPQDVRARGQDSLLNI